MTTHPSPGRGTWTRTGGLLPGKPGGKGNGGYYRLAMTPEAMVGSTWATGADASHGAQCVWTGVGVIQLLVGAEVDGEFGPLTSGRVLEAQKAASIEADAVVGPATMRALLTPDIEHWAQDAQVPVAYLGGLLVHESQLDPAAVGVNGLDHGIAQLNLADHPEITFAQAMNTDFSIRWSAEELFDVWSAWNGKTEGGVDPWFIAIAHHNSPSLAMQWARTGQAPIVKGRAFQIADYVDMVRLAW